MKNHSLSEYILNIAVAATYVNRESRKKGVSGEKRRPGKEPAGQELANYACFCIYWNQVEGGVIVKTPRLFLFALIPLTLASCVTAASVRFDVEHPPLVDLRGLNRISVIPFERGRPREFEYLSTHATLALTNGIRKNMELGNLTLVEPQTLANVPQHNFHRHVDVFINGRITDIHSSYTRRSNTRTIRGQRRDVITVTLTMVVDIEYSYIRASDGALLGTFSKRRRFSETADFAGMTPGSGGGSRQGWNLGTWHHPDWNRPGPWDRPGWFAPEADAERRRRGRDRMVFPRRDSWEERVAAAAINGFSFGMDRELASWVTREERTLLRVSGNEPRLDEAQNLARLGAYWHALLIYREIFERQGDVSAGFNAAILLAATGELAEAFGLLKDLHRGLEASGRNTPRFIVAEMERMATLVYRREIVEEQRTLAAAAPALAAVPPARGPAPSTAPPATTAAAPAIGDEPPQARSAAGTVNLNRAQIYALSEPIAYAEDASIWSRLVAAAESGSFDGRWTMTLPAAAPSSLWFVVADGRALYITQTALNASSSIDLDTAQMTRLE